jgi:hypothetical protein
MAARPKSYIRKQATAKFKRRWKMAGLSSGPLPASDADRSWRANASLGVRLDFGSLGSDFGRNVTPHRFQTQGCCAKRACCITVQHHDQPESW